MVKVSAHIAFAIVVLALIATNGLGLPREARSMMSEGKCKDDVMCRSVLPDCLGKVVCDHNGTCKCRLQTDASSQQECHTDKNCESHCLPPCDIPYCDRVNSKCYCEC